MRYGCDAPNGCASGMCSAERASIIKLALRTYNALALAALGLTPGLPYSRCFTCGVMVDWRIKATDTNAHYYRYVLPNGVEVRAAESGHIIPEAMGGRYCANNIITQCRPCNADWLDNVITEFAFNPLPVGKFGNMSKRTAAQEYRLATASDCPPVELMRHKVRDHSGRFAKTETRNYAQVPPPPPM